MTVPPTIEDRPRLGRVLSWLLGLCLAAMAGFGAWATLMPLNSAIIVRGTLQVETHRKSIQVLDTASIKTILVKEGDRVEAGQPLIAMDDTQARAARAVLQSQLDATLARRARLHAEREGEDTIAFPDDLRFRPDSPDVALLLHQQREQLLARRAAHQGKIALLGKQAAQTGEEIEAFKSEITGTRSQLQYTREEMAAVKELLDKGLERRPRYLSLQRTAAGLEGDLGRLAASLARSQRGIESAQLQIIDLENQRSREIADELETVDKELADLRQRLVAAEDVLRRATVTAPESGVVVDLKVFTKGGVVRSGETIMELVPQQDDLLIDVRVQPQDIDVVHAGLPAEVALTAFNRRKMPPLYGEVVRISADQLVDAATSEAYYSARIRLKADSRAAIRHLKLSPGMPADVMIVVGERTALDYLISPITDGLHRAMREP
ncbi:HlyD family type I secretion periplasmic adaptor subunit [Azospirillum sp.]|uniref:HlyD family type I secretion periplasmic adaptor subunit n=1 Tax=Azospirillum sp. TaxID=34012 RepID=UPI002D687631|nr:HlyD family type I secretion periplasmic adaptor subunit [Azospirillum sp.]HYD66545.1 HlyD family type I secretion periplasmic adaptor subunit [Azospirillum sp.]